jgi:hypothetical protein
MRGWIALDFGALDMWQARESDFDSGSVYNSTGRCSRHKRRRGFIMKAILKGSMHHNMRDGCTSSTTRQDGVFPEEDLLEIIDG